MRYLGALLLIAAAGLFAVAIWWSARSPNYERQVQAAGGLQTEMPSRVLLITVQPGNAVGRLRATLSDDASRTSYYADGLEGNQAWFLLFGDARLTNRRDAVMGTTERLWQGLSVDYQLVSVGVATGSAIVSGHQVQQPSHGTSRWEFAAPTLGVSCNELDRDLLRSIADDEDSLPATFADACSGLRADELVVTILTTGDERIETDSGPVRPPGTDQRQFRTVDADEQSGFEFSVSSASAASRATVVAAIAGILLGAVLSFAMQWLYDLCRKPANPACNASTLVPSSPGPSADKAPSLIGMALVLLSLFTGRNRP